MGGGSSAPRSLTLEQEQSSGVVKVSEAVARRLVGKPEPIESSPLPPSSLVSPSERNEEVQKLQSRYEKRIRSLEKQNKELHQTSTEQFAKAVEEVEKKFLKTTAAPICDDLQNEVMKCYQDNPKETLHCSQIVKSYSSCVQQQRESLLTKRDCQPCMLAQMARGPCGIQFMKAYDCYLEDRDKDDCAMLYLDMKECWDQHPDYGYQKLIDKVYDEGPAKTNSQQENTQKDNSKTTQKENNTKTTQESLKQTTEDRTRKTDDQTRKLS